MAKGENIVRSNPIEKYFDVMSRYHYYFFFCLFLCKLPLFWHMLNLIFLSPPMDFYCNNTASLDASADLKNHCPCDDPFWDRSVFTETAQTKYGLYCYTQWMISFSQSMLYVGCLIGAFLFGFLSDRFGRLSMLTMCILEVAVSGCLITTMPNAGSFIFMRCIEGIGVGGAIVTSYVLCVEYCGLRHRETVSALFHIPLNLGHITLPGVSYLLRHCDQFQLAISIPLFLFVGMKWILLESPKWLLDSGKVEKAVKTMETILKCNKQNSAGIKEEMESYHASQAQQNQTRISFWQIFKHRRLVINFACMAVIYFVCGMGYYGVSQYIGKMSGDIHKNVAISGTLLIPATLIASYLLKKLNRRTFLMATSFLSGIFMIIVICIPYHLSWLRVLLACFGNSFFFMSFIIVFLYGVELFPTSIRNSVLGVLSMISRIGQIIAPQINSLSPMVSGCVFGVLAIFGGVLCYPLPETKNTELPSTLDDSKTISGKNTSHAPAKRSAAQSSNSTGQPSSSVDQPSNANTKDE